MHTRSPVGRAVAVLEGASAVCLLALMVVVFVDVLGRSAINRPLPWGTELLEMLLGLLIFLLYPILALQGSHITVDLIGTRPSVQRFQRFLAGVIGATLFGIIAWCLGRQSLRAADYGEATPLLQVPQSWVLGVMCLLASVSALAFAVSTLRVLRRREPLPRAALETA